MIAVLSVVGFQLTASQLTAAAAGNAAAGTSVGSGSGGGSDTVPTVTVETSSGKPLTDSAETDKLSESSGSGSGGAVGWLHSIRDHPIVLFWGQLLNQRNFAVYAIIKFLQVFSCTFEKNHLAPFLVVFVGPALGVGSPLMSALIFASFVLPQILMLLENNRIASAGIYPVIRRLFLIKLCLPFAMLIISKYYQPAATAFCCLCRGDPAHI